MRERRAQARAALTPQATGGSSSSETNLIDARLQRLKLEGTPRVKREKRQVAPPMSPIPADLDFSDFMIPQMGNGVDYGSLAQKMMDDLFSVKLGPDSAEETQVGVDGERSGLEDVPEESLPLAEVAEEEEEDEDGADDPEQPEGSHADKRRSVTVSPGELGSLPTEGMLWALREEQEEVLDDVEEDDDDDGPMSPTPAVRVHPADDE